MSGDSATLDPLTAVRQVFTARQLPDSVVVCTPQLSVYSSGRMHVDVVADIPVRTVEHSIASEKKICVFIVKSKKSLTVDQKFIYFSNF